MTSIRRQPLTERPDPQLSFAMPRQHLRLRRESKRTWDAVQILRTAGCEVIRVGGHNHKVDGVLVSHSRLIWLAGKVTRLKKAMT